MTTAPADVADDHKVIAGGIHRRPSRLNSNALRSPEHPNLDHRPFDDLAERIAAKFTGDVIDRDQRLAGQ